MGPTAALLLTGSFVLAQPASPQPATSFTSLKNKSDAELLEFVAGKRDSSERYVSDENQGDLARPSPLDRLWEMNPPDAALALVTNYLRENEKSIRFVIDDPAAKPPAAGEIGIRWISGNEYAARQEGVTILRYDGYHSKLLISEVELDGRPSDAEIESAAMKTDEHLLSRAVAQQTYEILWWLRHVRFQAEPTSWSDGSVSSGDGLGRRFWMKPDGPSVEQILLSAPCASCIARQNAEAYASFSDTLLRRVIQRSGIKHRYPVPIVGKWKPGNADEEFLNRRPPPDRANAKATSEYVGRLTAILRNPERTEICDPVMERLVPISDPLRYPDKRIDDALIDLLHGGLQAKAAGTPQSVAEIDWSRHSDPAEIEKLEADQKRKRQQVRVEERRLDAIWFAGISAADKLGLHAARDAFDELFRLGKEKTIPLVPAATIASYYPEFRQPLADYLKDNLSLEEVWRADLRELSPQVEKAAQAAPLPNVADQSKATAEIARQATVLLATWNEPEKVTKTKLDILLAGDIGRASDIPRGLREEFSALGPDDQLNVKNFVTWMRTVDVPWSRHYLENTFTPHTPRPDIAFEH